MEIQQIREKKRDTENEMRKSLILRTEIEKKLTVCSGAINLFQYPAVQITNQRIKNIQQLNL